MLSALSRVSSQVWQVIWEEVGWEASSLPGQWRREHDWTLNYEGPASSKEQFFSLQELPAFMKKPGTWSVMQSAEVG